MNAEEFLLYLKEIIQGLDGVREGIIADASEQLKASMSKLDIVSEEELRMNLENIRQAYVAIDNSVVVAVLRQRLGI